MSMRQHASVHDNAGRSESATGGALPISLDQGWQHESVRITGLTAEEIQSGAVFETVFAPGGKP